MTSEKLIVANRRVAARKMGISYEQYEANLVAGLKWCRGCQQWHDRGEFSPAPGQFDGLAALCRPARRLDRAKTKAKAKAREQAAAEAAEDASEASVVARISSGWWPAPVEPRDEQALPREWPTWSVAGLVEQLVFFAADKACVGLDPETWFDDARVVEAKRVCWSCPVADSCLTAALRRGDAFGVFGGMTPDERDQIAGRVTPAWLEAV